MTLTSSTLSSTSRTGTSSALPSMINVANSWNDIGGGGATSGTIEKGWWEWRVGDGVA
jgi:hypothetical protein